MNDKKRRFSQFSHPLERVGLFFLGRYQGESLAVQANLRILLAVLLLGAISSSIQTIRAVLPGVLGRVDRGLAAGIGLGIARAIVGEHDGDLTFRSEPGKTQFHVRLPQAPAKEPDHGEVV